MSSDFELSRRRFLIGGMSAAGALSLGGNAAADAVYDDLKLLLEHSASLPSRAEMLRLLRAADASRFHPDDLEILQTIIRGMEREETLRLTFPFGKPDGGSPYVVSQRHGAWLEASTTRDAAKLASQLDEETERLHVAAAHGIIPPRFILDAVIKGERAHLSSPAGPALARQIRTLELLRPKAPIEPGVWQFPGGRDYYARRLSYMTDSDLPLEQDRSINADIGKLVARADALLKRLGLSHGTIGARLRALKQRPEYLYSNDEVGRARAIADMNAALERLRPHLSTWFNPPFEPASSVRLMSAAEEKAGKRGYRDPPTANGPGAYYPDLSNVHDRPAWTLTTVAYHEAIPGHLLQLRRQAIADPHPLQVRYALGYSEGWAIYAESLADRIGLLSLIEQIGFLQSVLFRYARFAADLGIHVHGWSRARAFHYLQDNVGFELFFPFLVEVDRYAVEPASFAGDALVAQLLQYKSPASPSRARRFHDRVLNYGPLSFRGVRAA